jgi:hypothetical protein
VTSWPSPSRAATRADPPPGVPNTPNDYRLMGQQMGLAIADYFDIHPSGETGWELLGEP